MPPLPRNPRYESLDVWRGVACLSVVVFHCVSGYYATSEFEAKLRRDGGSLADWGIVVASRFWIGVPFFFVISGYCIAAAADATRRKSLPGWTFFWRRARRIYPPLWAYLVLSALGIAVLPPSVLPGPTAAYPHPIPYPQDVPFGQWIGSITLTEEWRHYLVGPPRGYFTGQVWTLCYEEQFYLVVGTIVALSRRWLFPLLGLVTVVVALNALDLNALIGNLLNLDLNSLRRPLPGFFFDGLWLAFAAGIGVYYRAIYATPVVRWVLDGLLVVGIFWTVQYIPSVAEFKPTIPGYLGAAFGFALLLGWLNRFDRPLATSRLTAPFRWIGRMCYSLYLVHAPITLVIQWNFHRWGIDSSLGGLLVAVPVGVAVSLAAGQVFFRLVERSFLNSPPRP